MNKKTQTRARILAAAWQLFAEKGYEQTSTRDIALEADVATGTVFSHFANKLELLKAGLEGKLSTLLSEAAQCDTSHTATDRLCHYAGVLYPFYLSQREFSKVLLKELLWQSQSLDAQLSAFKLHLVGNDASQRLYADLLLDVYFMTLLEGLNEPHLSSQLLLARLQLKLKHICAPSLA